MAEQSSEDARRQLQDQAWRLNNLYWIRDRDGNVVPFRMNWAQEALFDELWFMSLVLKARQLGFSTFIMLLGLDTALFTPEFAAATIAHRLDAAEDLFERNIKFPYSRLPEGLRNGIGLAKDAARHYQFTNGSSYKVDVSARSGALQFLHVSEFGKVCATQPQKAREIVTGSLEAVGNGNVVAIESTAEGQEGYFYDFCQEALAREQQGKRPGWQDWQLFFFPWWEHPDYVLSPGQAQDVVITEERTRYFERVEAEIGQEITHEQRLWYVSKARRLGEDMFREYPSTPEEAFWAAIHGAYYETQLAKARQEGRITRIPIEPTVGVETWWDLGMDDATAIWFVQRVGFEVRCVDYYEASGEGLEHYAQVLQDKAQEHGFVYTAHYGPHDIAVRELGTGLSRLETAERMGIRFTTVPQHRVEDGIQAVRNAFSNIWIDEERCDRGLRGLAHYRKEWDERRGTYRNQPLHDWASHACLTAGHEILTTAGPVPIERVRVGDRVAITDKCSSRVTHAGFVGWRPTVWVKLSDGTRLECTKDHKFFTESGVIPADALRYNERVSTQGDPQWDLEDLSLSRGGIRDAVTSSTAVFGTGGGESVGSSSPSETVRSGCSTVSCGKKITEYLIARWRLFLAMETGRTSHRATGRSAEKGRIVMSRQSMSARYSAVCGTTELSAATTTPSIATSTYTAQSGATIMARFLTGITSTTSTMIAATTGSRTWKRLRRATIHGITRLITNGLVAKKMQSSSGERAKRQNTGIGPSRARRGIGVTANERGNADSLNKRDAQSVGESTQPTFLPGASTAAGRVAPARIVSVEPTGKVEPVYDITVAKHHCYWVNGVLTSNSDAVRTGIMGQGAASARRAVAVKKEAPGSRAFA